VVYVKVEFCHLLFNIYIDSLTLGLKSSGLGCHMQGLYVGCIAYADDLLLLSGSVVLLQKMLNMCSDHADLNEVICQCYSWYHRGKN